MQLNSDSFQMTYMHIVPPLALFLAKQPQVDNFDLKTLKTLVSAAAPLGGKLTEEVEQRLDVDFLQGRSCFWLLRLLLSSFFLAAQFVFTDICKFYHWNSTFSRNIFIYHMTSLLFSG